MKLRASRCEAGWIAWLLAGGLGLMAQAAPVILDPKTYHLRSGDPPEWQEFANRTPHGRNLELRFAARTNAAESTLFLRQDDVKRDWTVTLNGRRLGRLFLMEAPLVLALSVPPHTLREGTNTLALQPPRDNDDIEVGDFQLDPRPPAEDLSESFLEIAVTDAETGRPLPCRFTVTEARGALAALRAAPAPAGAGPARPLAVRPGVVYTGDGRARLGLRSGDYTVHASRGFEYSLDRQSVSITPGQTRSVQLRLRREVPTPGLVSCDTHIHTFTYARHGDATLEERMLTVAGEGLELPVSTEHNQVIDFAEAARAAGVAAWFTPVAGCEVTTTRGHFNIFPLAGTNTPDHRLTHWPELMAAIRALPGVQIVGLNHPRDVHAGFIPLAETNFVSVTGENRRGFEFEFNAVELINSGAHRSDLMEVYRDWFGLLNYGHRVVGLGSSDSHDVSRFIVGQGRTYIECADEDPARLNLEAACRSLRDGRALVSMGLLTLLEVDGRFRPGDLATGLGDSLQVTATVLGPSWAEADRLELYANGLLVRQERLAATAGVQKARVTWRLPRPAHDVHLVAIASGPGITSPHWAIARPYQPSSPVWEPRVLGSTNPIWVDADGDGRFTAARGYARAVVERTGPRPAELLPALARFDEAVAAQAASLCLAAGLDLAAPELTRALETAPEPVRKGFAAFRAAQGQTQP